MAQVVSKQRREQYVLQAQAPTPHLHMDKLRPVPQAAAAAAAAPAAPVVPSATVRPTAFLMPPWAELVPIFRGLDLRPAAAVLIELLPGRASFSATPEARCSCLLCLTFRLRAFMPTLFDLQVESVKAVEGDVAQLKMSLLSQ